MKQRILAEWIVMVLLSGNCFAADPMEERAWQLALALNISTNITTHAPCKPIFAEKDTLKVGEFLVKQNKTVGFDPNERIHIDILDKNGQVVAGGQIFVRPSFEMARMALLKSLVLNSMTIDMVARTLEVRDGEGWDLCIIEKTFDKINHKFISDPALIHFVRGCTAVSIYPVGKERDIWKITKALDTAMSELSNDGKPVGSKNSSGTR